MPTQAQTRKEPLHAPGSGGRVALGDDRRRVQLVDASDPSETSTGGSVKRALDIVFAVLGLVLSAPLWPAIALAIKLEDGGQVFFSHHRVGKGGRLFRKYKFRSMTPRRDEVTAPAQAQLEESRITRVGSFLRATALDELPQLWNILRGDMSFVGPRPLLPMETEANGSGKPVHLRQIRGYGERHRIRPGLTGIAQVYTPRDLPHKKKFRYDLFYVRNRNVLMDLALIFRSVWISLRAGWPEVGQRGAERSG